MVKLGAISWEEVLAEVEKTQVSEKEPQYQEGPRPVRAADILAQRLPTVTPKAPDKTGSEPPPTSALYAKKAPSAAETPAGTPPIKKKPAEAAPGSQSAPTSTNPAQSGASLGDPQPGASSAANGNEPPASEPKKPKALSSAESAQPKPAPPPENAQPQENPR